MPFDGVVLDALPGVIPEASPLELVVLVPGVAPVPGAGVVLGDIVVPGVVPFGDVVFDALPWEIPEASPFVFVVLVPGVAPVPGAGAVLVPLLDDVPPDAAL
jgi:hypothetical protein